MKDSTPFHPVALNRFKPPNYPQYRDLLIAIIHLGYLSVWIYNKTKKCKKKMQVKIGFDPRETFG
jgi:hypothetical protein